jgi:O-acetyl-ADP-ribose deacetylase (regulator of RNase III)
VKVTVVRGDITQVATDAIVNAANEGMLGGGGVDGAIHRAAGKALRHACEKVPEVAPGVRCPTGQARITPGFGLPAKYVIHTVGPRYAMANAPALLESAFLRSLELASAQADIRSVAFPAISCGVFGYPIEKAAAIAVRAACSRAWDLDEIRFVLFSEADRAVFQSALKT